jgi:hypothetical protein
MFDAAHSFRPTTPTTTSYPTTTTTTTATSSSTGDMKLHLQNLLDSKEKQLQQAATLGQRVLAQRVELEERIRQLQEMDADKPEEEEIDSEARERYRELAETIEGWDMENTVLSSAFGPGKVSIFFRCHQKLFLCGILLIYSFFFSVCEWSGNDTV